MFKSILAYLKVQRLFPQLLERIIGSQSVHLYFAFKLLRKVTKVGVS